MEQEIKAVFKKAIDNQWSYPQVFDALKDIGVRSYVTDVANYKINYQWESGSFLESGPSDFKANVGSEFKEADVIKAIRRSQRREIDYPTFLKEIAAAGVPKYRVDMAERTVTYMGHNETQNRYTEKVP